MVKMGQKSTGSRKPMNKISLKQAARLRDYHKTEVDLILNRAKGRCEKCNCLGDWRGLSCHHIKKRRFNDDSPENLIVLCGRCHSLEEHIREV